MSEPATHQEPNETSEAIMARIRSAIRERRAASGLSDAEFDALATGAPGQPTIDDFRHNLDRLADALRYTGIEMIVSDVRPSPVSGLVQQARAALHEVVLFYVNRAAAQQAIANRLTLQALRTALALLEAQQALITELERKGTSSQP